MEDFEPPFAEKPHPGRKDIHATDVLMRFTEARGASYYSVIEPADARGMVLVQNQNGSQFWAQPSSFVMRYSLRDSGKFSLVWRFSPIEAVANHKASKGS